MFPMCMETFSADEWAEIGKQLEDPEMATYRAPEQAEAPVGDKGRVLNLEVGALTPDQINLVLTHLPVDVTYVDENDEVRYFSLGKERIFERTPAVIGRKGRTATHPQAFTSWSRSSAISGVANGTEQTSGSSQVVSLS